MRRTDLDMRTRLVEEISKLGKDPVTISKRVGCSPQLIRLWLNEEATPSAWYLRRLHELDCDILYILTGGESRCSTPR